MAVPQCVGYFSSSERKMHWKFLNVSISFLVIRCGCSSSPIPALIDSNNRKEGLRVRVWVI